MIPHEKALVKRLKDQPFALLGINSDRNKSYYHRRAKEMGVTWRSSWQGGTEGPIPTQWNVSSWPTIFILDHKGVIRFKNLRGEKMDEAVEKLLEEAKATGG